MHGGDSRERFATSLLGDKRTRLDLTWDREEGERWRGHDLVTLLAPWTMPRDPHPTFDRATRAMHRDATLLVAMEHKPYGNRWMERDEGYSWTATQLETLLRDRFEQVEIYHQDPAAQFEVKPGAPGVMPIYLGVARQPKTPALAPLVSLVIPVFNKADLTENCLRAIAAVTPAEGIPFETIVVDNGSWDKTQLVLHQASHLPELRLKTISNQQNLGFAKACNQGAIVARGRIVLFLNNDTEPRAGWLAPLVEELDLHHETGAVGAKLLYPDGTIQHAGVAIGKNQIPYHIHCGKAADDPIVNERRIYPIVTGACLAVRRQEFYAIGMFDEAYINGTEDIDLCLRYNASGRHCVYRPDSVTIHHESQSEGRMRHREKNIERLFDRWREQLIPDDFTLNMPLARVKSPERKLRFAIKIGVPNRRHRDWGDVFFAEGLGKALATQGHGCEIHYLNEWGKDDRDIDVVIHIKGLSRYRPKPWSVNLLWMINHPSLHTTEELNQYDAVLVASELHAATLRGQLSVPVIEFLQATDPDRFRPIEEQPKRWDMVFVGNNGGKDRERIRRTVADLLPTRHKLAVWGSGWTGLLPNGVWQGEFVPAEEVPIVYNSAWIVLNDHQSEMKRHGFVNNRTFDAAACGAIVVSDYVEGIQNTIGVHTWRSQTGLRNLVDRLLKTKQIEAKKAAAMRSEVLAKFSFDARAEEIVRIAEPYLAKRRPFPALATENGPLVSVLISTHDRRAFLPDTIATLQAQSYPNWELQLINDGGPSVREIVEASADRRIKLTELPRNAGKGHALNIAANQAAGSYFAYQDDDDIWRPYHLESLLRPLLHVPGVDFAYGAALDAHLEQQPDGSWLQVKRELVYDRAVQTADLLFYNQIQGITVAHKRELFFAAGGYDEKLKVLIDWDLWRRVCSLAPPYFVSRVTAERTYRKSMSAATTTSGTGHLTRLIDRDPVAYYLNRMRILRKPLPSHEYLENSDILRKLRSAGRFELLVMIAEQRMVRGQFVKALRSFQRLALLRPENVVGWRGIANCLLRAGQLNEALEAFAQTLRTGPTQPTDFLFAALSAIGAKQPEAALALLEALPKNHPEEARQQAALIEEYRQRARQLQQQSSASKQPANSPAVARV